MFAGHYAVGFYLKKKYQEIPLWLLFLAVHLLDTIFAILLPLGIEKTTYTPTNTFYLSTSYDYIPYSHSLFSAVLIAISVYLIFDRIRNKTWATGLSLAILSHWFIDLIVLNPQLPILFNRFKVGLGLWQYTGPALILELALIAAGVTYFLKDNTAKKERTRTYITEGVLIAMTFGMFLPPPSAYPSNPLHAGAIMILVFTIIAGLGYWIERK